jgi:predicted nucleic acid-binding protein
MNLAIDTSAILAVLLNEPSRPALVHATEGHALIGAPTLPWEVGNALVAGFRRKRLTSQVIQRAWASYQLVQIRLEEIDVSSALEIALDLGLYAYDAYVLQMARAARVPLITLDRGMALAAIRLGVKTPEFQV